MNKHIKTQYKKHTQKVSTQVFFEKRNRSRVSQAQQPVNQNSVQNMTLQAQTSTSTQFTNNMSLTASVVAPNSTNKVQMQNSIYKQQITSYEKCQKSLLNDFNAIHMQLMKNEMQKKQVDMEETEV